MIDIETIQQKIDPITAYQIEKEQKKAKLSCDLTAIGALLGMKPDLSHEWDHGGYLRDEEGHALFVRADWQKKRYEVSVLWPKSNVSGWVSTSPRDLGVVDRDSDYVDEINISMNKSNEKQASDIKRRLLPDYFRLFKICEEKQAERTAYANAKEALKKELAESVGREVREGSDTIHFHFDSIGYGEAKVSSSQSVSISLSSISPEIAKKILNIFKEVQS